MQVRDWLYVRDHCSAIRRVLEAGGGRDLQRRRLERKAQHRDRETVCALLDELRRARRWPKLRQPDQLRDRPPRPRPPLRHRRAQARARMGWKPAETFDTGIRKTVEWYLATRTGWPRCKRRLPRMGGKQYA